LKGKWLYIERKHYHENIIGNFATTEEFTVPWTIHESDGSCKCSIKA